jgi:hypothetical protein
MCLSAAAGVLLNPALPALSRRLCANDELRRSPIRGARGAAAGDRSCVRRPPRWLLDEASADAIVGSRVRTNRSATTLHRMEVLLVIAILAAALACPAMMWYSNKRGRASACCPPRREAEPDIGRLKAERDALDQRIATEEAAAPVGRR